MDASSSTSVTPTVADPPTAVPASAPPADAPTNPSSEKHPSYDEMICTAIATLNEGKGSTKNAIGKFMGQTYQGLPSNHNDLLIEHLNVLTSDGRLVMVKKSYQLRNSDASPSTSPRKPGRTRKRKRDQSLPDVPLNASPPKKRGRPRKIEENITAVPVPFAPPSGVPEPVYAVPPSGASPQAVGAGSSRGVRTPQDPVGSSVGRPKKVTSVEKELRRKLEHFQSKINQHFPEIKSHFTIENSIKVIIAIKELEKLATMDLDGPLTNETQELPPQQ